MLKLLQAGRGTNPTDNTHHIEFLLFNPIARCGIPYGHIFRYRVLFLYRHIAPMNRILKVLCSLIESFKVLAVGTQDIVVEYGAPRVSVMVFCQDHLLLGIGAAYRGTVTVAAWGDLPGADAVYPGYIMRMPLVGGAEDSPS